MADAGISLTAAELAAQLEGSLEGEGSVALTGLAGLREAGPGDVTFMADPRYTAAVASTQASAVLVPRDWEGTTAATVIRVDDPATAFASVVASVAPPPVVPPAGVHPTAVVADDAVLGEGVSIGPHVVVEPGARVGARTALYAGCYVGHAVAIGTDCVCYPHVSIRERCTIGDRTTIHNGTVIGSDGFGYDRNADGSWTKIPQVGVVEIGSDVEIGANVTIDRARFGRTVIADGAKLDNLIQIAHNVQIGENTAVAALAALAGSTLIGRNVQLGGMASSAGHVSVGDNSVIVGRTSIVKDVPAGSFMMGLTATPASRYKRIFAATQRLPELVKRVKDLEKQVKEQGTS